MEVYKFGGTSVANATRIKGALDIVINNGVEVVVLSAMKGITNLLIECAEYAESGNKTYKECVQEIKDKQVTAVHELFSGEKAEEVEEILLKIIEELEDLLHGVELVKECSLRSLDFISSFGERLNCTLVTEYLNEIGHKAYLVDARKVIKTDSNFGAANVDFKLSYDHINKKIDPEKGIAVVTGFIASNEECITTTLGRNGSDYTAAIVGAALDADSVQIWTDVDGVLTADPRIVQNAYVIPELSIMEAMEMSYFGAEVIHPYTLRPVVEKNIPVYIKNTLNPSAVGTLIAKDVKKNEKEITGLASIDNVSILNLEGGGMLGMPGMASKIFESLARNEINILMITQASSEHSISVVIRKSEVQRAVKGLKTDLEEAIAQQKIQNIDVIHGLEIIAVIGDNMRGRIGFSGRLFSALGEKEVNVLAIAQGSTEKNISLIIRSEEKAKALNAIHKTFLG
jgi:bifunctional aspartokinase / homoserine dehydrogenase 1